MGLVISLLMISCIYPWDILYEFLKIYIIKVKGLYMHIYGNQTI